MKSLKIFTFTVITAAILAGCKSTGMSSLNKGNYFKACLQAVEKLRSSPNNTEAMDALTKAYPMAIHYTKMENERLQMAVSNPNRYEQRFDLYNSMNNIAVQISRCPAALRVIPNADYYNTELESLRTLAAEECYQIAEAHLRAGNLAAARQAYSQFVKVNTIIPGYKDVVDKIEDSKWKVLLEPVSVAGTYQLTADFFYNKMYEYLTKNIRDEFIYILSPEEAYAGNVYPDQIVRLQFLNFSVGQVRESSNTYEVKQENVKTGTYTDSNGTHDVFGTVKANITARSREVSSSGVLDAFIVDARTNTVLSQQRFSGAFVWQDSYATFNGDERALSKKELDMCRRTSFAPQPSPQDMFIEVSTPIYSNLTGFIQSYYRNY